MNSYKSTIAIALVSALFSSPSALANTDKKFEVSAGYQVVKIDDSSIDLTGAYAQGRYQFDNKLYIRVKHFNTEEDLRFSRTLEFQQTNVGVGKIFNIDESNKYTAFLQADFLSGEISTVDYNGGSIDVGLNAGLTKEIKLTAGFRREWLNFDFGQATENESVIYSTANYQLNTNFGLTATYELYDEADRYQIGISYQF